MPKAPSIRQKRAVEQVVANGSAKNPKSLATIMKDVGYSDAIAEVPSKVTESKGFKELLEIYLPQDLVAQRHVELLNSGTLNEYEFYAKEITEQNTDVEEEDELNNRANKRAERKSPTKKRVPVDDADIKLTIESVPGCKLIFIKAYTTGTKVAYFSQPDNRSRKDAIDMAYKIRGQYVQPEDPKKNPLSQMIGDAVLEKIADKLNEQLRANQLRTSDARTGEPSNGASADPMGDKVQS